MIYCPVSAQYCPVLPFTAHHSLDLIKPNTSDPVADLATQGRQLSPEPCALTPAPEVGELPWQAERCLRGRYVLTLTPHSFSPLVSNKLALMSALPLPPAHAAPELSHLSSVVSVGDHRLIVARSHAGALEAGHRSAMPEGGHCTTAGNGSFHQYYHLLVPEPHAHVTPSAACRAGATSQAGRPGGICDEGAHLSSCTGSSTPGTLHPEPRGRLQVFVKKLDGKTMVLDMERSDTVELVKQIIQDRLGECQVGGSGS